MCCDWHFRHATEQDLDAVFGIALLSPSAPQWTAAQYLDLFTSKVNAAQKRVILLAEQDCEVTGFAVVSAICSIFPSEAELESIAVAPERRARGVGRGLVRSAVIWAALQEAERLRLEVRAGNSSALRLYLAMGFQVIGTRARYYSDPMEDAVCMERSVL